MIIESTLTSKGQTTIPAEIRAFLKAGAGDRLIYVVRDGDIILKARTRRAQEMRGMFRQAGRAPLTETELEDLIADAAASGNPVDE